MTVLLRKEIRSLLPAWVMSMVATVLIAFVPLANGSEMVLLLTVVAIGSLLLGITSFGSEFSQGTFSLLLSQPIPRNKIWRTKTITLGVALLSVATLVFWVSVSRTTKIFGPSTPVRLDQLAMGFIFLLAYFGAAFAGGLLSTLTTRQMATAFWIALLFPLAIYGGVEILTLGRSERTIYISTSAALAAYDVLAFLLARRQFLRAQDLPGATGTVISLPAWMRFGTKAQSATTAPSYRPWRALIVKEFQLHQVSLGFAAVLLVLHVIVLVIRRMIFVPGGVRQKDIYEVLGVWWLLWFFVPVMIASVAIAEERRQATLEGSLSLPARRSMQWFIKCAVCFFLAILFGGVMPWLLEVVARFIGCPAPMFHINFANHWDFLGGTVTVAAIITLVAFYASSLARNLLQALGIAVLVASVLGWVVVHLAAVSTYYHVGLLLRGLLLRFGLPSLFALLLWLSYHNFKHPAVGWRFWLKNASVLLVVGLLAYGAVWVLFSDNSMHANW